MKKALQLLLLISVLQFSLESCQKEVNDFANNIIDSIPANQNDSIFIDKIVYLGPTGTDTLYKMIFTYDAQKRISEWSVIETDTLLVKCTYTYQGSDSLPNKSELLEKDGDYLTITYHSYDASKRNIKDSAIQSILNIPGADTVVSIYSYNTGKRYGITTKGTDVSKDTADIDANDNLLFAKHYNQSTLGEYLFSTSQFSYDNKLNPLARQWIYKAHQKFPLGETLFYDYFSYNNKISQSEFVFTVGGTSNPSIQSNTTYTYNANNLPITATEIFNSDTVLVHYKYKP